MPHSKSGLVWRRRDPNPRRLATDVDPYPVPLGSNYRNGGRWVGAREVSGVSRWPRTDCGGGAAQTSLGVTLAAVGAAAGSRFPTGCRRATRPREDYRDSSDAGAVGASSQTPPLMGEGTLSRLTRAASNVGKLRCFAGGPGHIRIWSADTAVELHSKRGAGTPRGVGVV
jgi:hypothetical protein